MGKILSCLPHREILWKVSLGLSEDFSGPALEKQYTPPHQGAPPLTKENKLNAGLERNHR
jgi:hypothetical protein